MPEQKPEYQGVDSGDLVWSELTMVVAVFILLVCGFFGCSPAHGAEAVRIYEAGSQVVVGEKSAVLSFHAFQATTAALVDRSRLDSALNTAQRALDAADSAYKQQRMAREKQEAVTAQVEQKVVLLDSANREIQRLAGVQARKAHSRGFWSGLRWGVGGAVAGGLGLLTAFALMF